MAEQCLEVEWLCLALWLSQEMDDGAGRGCLSCVALLPAFTGAGASSCEVCKYP